MYLNSKRDSFIIIIARKVPTGPVLIQYRVLADRFNHLNPAQQNMLETVAKQIIDCFLCEVNKLGD